MRLEPRRTRAWQVCGSGGIRDEQRTGREAVSLYSSLKRVAYGKSGTVKGNGTSTVHYITLVDNRSHLAHPIGAEREPRASRKRVRSAGAEPPAPQPRACAPWPCLPPAPPHHPARVKKPMGTELSCDLSVRMLLGSVIMVSCYGSHTRIYLSIVDLLFTRYNNNI